jgi:regulatory protein
MDDGEDFQKLLNYAYFFLKFRPRTKKELQQYLYKKIQKLHWSQSDADKVVYHLEERHLINDEDFTKWFVEQRTILKPKSTFVLKNELLQHGVTKEIIEAFFSEHVLDEEKLALQILIPRWQRYQSINKKERFEKAASFLLRRGFSFDIVKKTIAKLEEENV